MLSDNSCKKEYSCEDCNPIQKPPIANGGKDTTILFPSSTVILNGSASSDPDGNIAGFLWTKISGPANFKLETYHSTSGTITVNPGYGCIIQKIVF